MFPFPLGIIAFLSMACNAGRNAPGRDLDGLELLAFEFGVVDGEEGDESPLLLLIILERTPIAAKARIVLPGMDRSALCTAGNADWHLISASTAFMSTKYTERKKTTC